MADKEKQREIIIIGSAGVNVDEAATFLKRCAEDQGATLIEDRIIFGPQSMANHKAPSFNFTNITLAWLVRLFEVLNDNVLIDENTYKNAAAFAAQHFSIEGIRVNRESFKSTRSAIKSGKRPDKFGTADIAKLVDQISPSSKQPLGG